MPANIRGVETNCAEAEVLADLYSIRNDLQSVAEICGRIATLSTVARADHSLIDWLFSAALVRYFRCFSHGARLGLRRADIEGLEPEALGAHDYFKDLRDKYIAHSVNPFERTVVTAIVVDRDGVKEDVRSVGHSDHRVLFGAQQALSLAALTERVLGVVELMISVEEPRVLAIFRSMPLDLIHSFDLPAPLEIKTKDVGRSRKQTRKHTRTLTSASTRTPKQRP